MNNTLVMTTKNGIQLFFNAEREEFTSSNPRAIIDALKEDMASIDEIAAKMASMIWIAISMAGGIKPSDGYKRCTVLRLYKK